MCIRDRSEEGEAAAEPVQDISDAAADTPVEEPAQAADTPTAEPVSYTHLDVYKRQVQGTLTVDEKSGKKQNIEFSQES